MAKKKLSYDQIADNNLLDPLIEELKQVNKLLGLTAEGLKLVAKESAEIAKSTPLESFENIEKVEKSIRKTTDAVEQLDQVEKDRIKLSQRLKDLDDVRTKSNFELREEIRLQTKELRDQAKESKALEDAYKKLTKRTNEAQANFKKLAAEFGVTSDQAQKAQKEFNELDAELGEINKAAKDGRRDVGRYGDAIEESGEKGLFAGTAIDDLKGKFKALLANPIILFAVALAAALALLFKAFQGSSKGAVLLRKGAALLEAGFSVLTDFVNDAVEAIIKFTEDPLQGIKDLGNAIVENVINRFKAIPDLIRGLGKLFGQLIRGEFGEISGTFKEIANSAIQLGTGVEDVVEKLSSLGETINDVANAFLLLEAAQRRVRVENRNLIQQLAEVQKAQEILAAQAEDDGRSLEEQRKAIRAAGIERQKQAEIELTIARNNLDLLNQEVNLRRAQGQDIQDLLDEQAQTRVEFVDKQKESTIAIFENAARERMIILDIFDQELDDLVDFGDNLKTIREQQAGDERNDFEQRREALDAANADIEKSFKSQVQLFDETVNALKVSRGEAADFALPIEELLGIEDAVELNEAVKSLDLVERQRIRLLEIIREIRIARNDLTTATRDLNDAEKESNQVQDDAILIAEAIMSLNAEQIESEEILQELSDARLQSEINNLEIRLASAVENSGEFININNELQEKLLQQTLNRISAEEAAEKERLEQLKELSETAFEILGDIASKAFEKRLSQIEEEIAAEQNRLERLKDLAAEGNEDAQNNLAITQKRQAELELEREKQLKRQKQSELALAAIETYSAKVAEGEKNPLAATITDIAVLRAFVASLPGFFHGTEDTGTGGMLKDGHGKITGFTHEKERVLSAEQNKLVGPMGNMELALLASNAVKSTTYDRTPDSNRELISEIKDLKRITDAKPVYKGMDYNEIERSVIHTIERKGKLERIHKKKGGIWG